MLERVQSRSWLQDMDMGVHLHGAQKALAQWAIVDDYDNILDMHCEDAQLLRYLAQKYSLRACGIADDPEHARALRNGFGDAEIFCARKEDIPWRDESFDAVFYQMKKNEYGFSGGFMREAMRVLKPGGQMLMAVSGAPEALHQAASLLGIGEADEHVKPAQILTAMEEAGFDDVSWRMATPFISIAMGWKRS